MDDFPFSGNNRNATLYFTRINFFSKKKKLGKILWMRGVYGKAGSIDFNKNWRNYKKYSGGGILLDQGIHMLDLINYFSGGFDNV